MHHTTLVISIDDKLTLLVELAISNFAHMNDTGSVLMIAEHYISLSFALTTGFTRLWLNL